MKTKKYIYIIIISILTLSCNSNKNDFDKKLIKLAEEESKKAVIFGDIYTRPARNKGDNKSEAAQQYFLYHKIKREFESTIEICNIIIKNTDDDSFYYNELNNNLDTIYFLVDKILFYQNGFSSITIDNITDTFYANDYLNFLKYELKNNKAETNIHYTKLILSLILKDATKTLSHPRSFFSIDVNHIEPLMIEKETNFECYMNIIDTLRDNKIIIESLSDKNNTQTILFDKTKAIIPKNLIKNSKVFLTLETSYGIYSSREILKSK
jgi:hypothetical protein|tara:strand:+ start:74 stop:874 length:801 start_codon:yes stop_codon:yes gene_type:complete